jgi:antibiotic biosynthesis monooxygenase
MKRAWVVLWLYACSSIPLPEKSLYVAEGEHHVASWSEQDASSLTGHEQIATLTADARAAHGNIAVYVMRAERRANFVVVLTIWESPEDLAAWRKRSGDSGRDYDVQLELTR